MQHLLHRVFCRNFYGIEPGSKGGASELRLPMPRLISPSLGIFPPLLSELDYNSKPDVVLVLCL